jgi:hypothetical protein
MCVCVFNCSAEDGPEGKSQCKAIKKIELKSSTCGKTKIKIKNSNLYGLVFPVS